MTIVILDIDGVLNPFGARYNYNLPFREIGSVFLLPEMQTPWIKKIKEHAKFVWGSAWEQNSNRLLEWLELEDEPDWEWIPMQWTDVGTGTWKIKAIRKYLKDAGIPDDEKVVWLDDELEEDAFLWASERGNMLCIAPDRYLGLTDEQYAEIYEFVKPYV